MSPVEIQENLDKILAWLGIIASIALVAVLAFTVRRLVFILVGVLIAFSCLLWLGIRSMRDRCSRMSVTPGWKPATVVSLPCCFSSSWRCNTKHHCTLPSHVPL